MKNTDLIESWQHSNHLSPKVDAEKINQLLEANSVSLIERYKKRSKKWIMASTIVEAIIAAAFFIAGIPIVGIILLGIISSGLLVELFFLKKISLIDYDQRVLSYLKKFRSQLMGIVRLDIIVSILMVLAIYPLLFLVGINSYLGSDAILSLSPFLQNSGLWVGFFIGEIMMIATFASIFYQRIIKTVREIDQRIERLEELN